MDLVTKTHQALTPESPNFHSSNEPSFPIIAIAIIGILATAFLLVSYYIFVIKCCLNWHRIDVLRRFSLSRSRSHQELLAAHSDQTHRRRGLDESVIRSIPVFHFKNDAKIGVVSNECAVCLSDFRHDERLRIIPTCCHVFHIDCIDVWLQNNDNCPLCRSSVSSAANDAFVRIDGAVVAPTSTPAATGVDRVEEEEEEEDFVVIELTGNDSDVGGQSEPSGISRNKMMMKGTSMGDECIEIGRDNWVQPIRRSFSMDSSADRKMFMAIQDAVRQHNIGISPNNNTNNNNNLNNNDSILLGSCSGNRSVRRSFFSFSHGSRGSSRSAVLPVYLEP